jgi:primosomal protein N'
MDTSAENSLISRGNELIAPMIFAVQLVSKQDSTVARVAIDSPLPNLDRLFDYVIPPELAQIANVGSRVRVPFGRSKKMLDGFVVEIIKESEFAGKLASIAEIVSTVPVLPQTSYAFLRAIADRQACAIGDLLKLAVPNRSVAVEKKFLLEELGYSTEQKRSKKYLGQQHARLCEVPIGSRVQLHSLSSRFSGPGDTKASAFNGAD